MVGFDELTLASIRGSATIFQGNGLILGDLKISGAARADLTDDLTIAGTLELHNSELHLHGFTLVANGTQADPAILNSGGTIFLDGGTLRGSGTQGIQNSGTIRGNGTIDASRLEFGANGVQIVGEPGQAGSVMVTGDYVLSPTALLNFDIGGKQPGSLDQLVIQGAATLDGTLEAFLINGFVPALTPTPDEFDIITFASAGGCFDSTRLDLGNGLFFDVSQQSNKVALVTSA